MPLPIYAAIMVLNRAERDGQEPKATCPKGATGGEHQFIAYAIRDWLAQRGIKTH